MISKKGLARLSSAVGLLAVAFMTAALFASTAHAQNPPATMYGTTTANTKVEALVGGKVCQSVTSGTTDGFWQMQIPEGGTCGATDGATITFTLGGAGCSATETWKAGGAPKTVATGVALTAATCTGAGAVTPPKTGNAGLLGSGNDATSGMLVLALAVLALGTVAGARVYAGRGR